MSRNRDKAGGAPSQKQAAPQCPPGPSVATASLEPPIPEPLEPVWQLLKHPFRLPLLELASATMPRSQSDE
jgi:hypothetical protein